MNFVVFEMSSWLLTVRWSQCLRIAAPALLLCLVPQSNLPNGLWGLRGPLFGRQMSSVLPPPLGQ